MNLTTERISFDWQERYSSVVSRLTAVGFDQTPEWFEAYLSCGVSSSKDTSMMAVRGEDGALVLAMPVQSAVIGRLSVRCIEALSNYYTSLYAPLIIGDEVVQKDAVSCLVSGLGVGGDWDELILQPLDTDGLFYQALCDSLSNVGYKYVGDECFVNWYLDVNGRDYEAYEQSLPSKLRNTFKRKERKLQREQGYDIRISADDDDLDRLISDYEAVYAQSWKSEESHPEFIRTIIKSFARKGWLRLGLLYVEGVPAAAQLWFVKDGVASIYKLSYDGRYSKYSVGSILTAALMRQVIDVDKVGLVDFLTGDDAYKKDWMSHHQARHRIRIYNKKTWRGRVLALWNLKIKRMLGRS